jgi:hypothetical protein
MGKPSIVEDAVPTSPEAASPDPPSSDTADCHPELAAALAGPEASGSHPGVDEHLRQCNEYNDSVRHLMGKYFLLFTGHLLAPIGKDNSTTPDHRRYPFQRVPRVGILEWADVKPSSTPTCYRFDVGRGMIYGPDDNGQVSRDVTGHHLRRHLTRRFQTTADDSGDTTPPEQSKKRAPGLALTDDENATRVIIVKDLNPEVIGTLGSCLGLVPDFFAAHIQGSQYHNVKLTDPRPYVTTTWYRLVKPSGLGGAYIRNDNLQRYPIILESIPDQSPEDRDSTFMVLEEQASVYYLPHSTRTGKSFQTSETWACASTYSFN